MSLKRAFYEKRWVSRLFFLGLFALVWAGAARFSGISPLLLPPPGLVLAALAVEFVAHGVRTLATGVA